MALKDIIDRIESEATQEARELVEAAEAESQRVVATARREAERAFERELERARAAAAAESETIVANARLAARDRALAERRALLDELFGRLETEVAELPPEAYVSLFAARIAAVARPGETVLVASADVGRLAGLRERVAQIAPGLDLTWSDEPAGVGHGVVVVGARARADLSVASILADRRDSVEAVMSENLFGGGGR